MYVGEEENELPQPYPAYDAMLLDSAAETITHNFSTTDILEDALRTVLCRAVPL